MFVEDSQELSFPDTFSDARAKFAEGETVSTTSGSLSKDMSWTVTPPSSVQYLRACNACGCRAPDELADFCSRCGFSLDDASLADSASFTKPPPRDLEMAPAERYTPGQNYEGMSATAKRSFFAPHPSSGDLSSTLSYPWSPQRAQDQYGNGQEQYGKGQAQYGTGQDQYGQGLS